MVDEVFGIIRSTTMPLFYKIGASILSVAQYFYKLVQFGEIKQGIRDTEAGQSLQAAIQARFAAQNSVLLAEFEDLINAEEAKLPSLIRVSTKMQFIKYRKDFYSSLQTKNMDSFEELSDLYYTKIVELTEGGKSEMSTSQLDKLVKDVQKAFDEKAQLNFQELSKEYIEKVKDEVIRKFNPQAALNNLSVY